MKFVFVIILLFSVVYGGFAQGKLSDEKRKEFDAQKVAFFTQELDLSPAEAARFWPIYNEMQKKNRVVEDNMRKGFREVKDAKGLKETDYKEAIGKMLAYEGQMQEIKEEYYQKMLTVLPASKIWKLSDAERRFHRQLFEKLRREGSPKK